MLLFSKRKLAIDVSVSMIVVGLCWLVNHVHIVVVFIELNYITIHFFLLWIFNYSLEESFIGISCSRYRNLRSFEIFFTITC